MSLPPVDPMVEGTLAWSMLAPSDVPALMELREAIDYFDDPIEPDTDDVMRSHLVDRKNEPERNCVVGRDMGGTVVAYGWNLPDVRDIQTPRIWLDGGIHPAWRHQTIGYALIVWQINRALVWDSEHRDDDWGDLWCGRLVDTKNTRLTHLMDQCDFVAERWFFDMAAPLTEPLPFAPPPPGVEIVAYQPAFADEVREVHNLAFRDEPGASDVTPAEWQSSLDRPDAREEWSWVARADGQVVGYAMASVDESDDVRFGWTDRLGVHPDWRRRGLAKALLAASMRSMADDGCDAAWLGLDTNLPEAARTLYGSLGYVTTDVAARYGRVFGAAERRHHPVFD